MRFGDLLFKCGERGTIIPTASIVREDSAPGNACEATTNLVMAHETNSIATVG
jgi:hypothetical protein